jgi:serine/threonine protein phosphatase PrpC
MTPRLQQQASAAAAPEAQRSPRRSIAASVLGRSHARTGRNNQDAFAIGEALGWTAAVVADGCSAGASSEVGARLGARFAVARLLELVGQGLAPAELSAQFKALLLLDLRKLVELAGGDPGEFIGEHLLFTVLAAAWNGERAVVLAAGDGLVAVDGQLQVLDSGPSNAPAYLAYGLLRDAPAPVVLHAGPARTVALGTDGVAELVRAQPETFEALLDEELVFANPFTLQRRFNVWSSKQRLFQDDATLVLMR